MHLWKQKYAMQTPIIPFKSSVAIPFVVEADNSSNQIIELLFFFVGFTYEN